MKTQHFLTAGLIALAAIFISSCSSTESYVKYIPEDADVVFCVDAGSIVSKSGIEDNTSAIRAFEKYFSDYYGDDEFGACVKAMLEDPEKASGLNLKSRIYLYGTYDAEYEEIGDLNILFGIKDRETLLDNIMTLTYGDFEFEETDDYIYFCDYETAVVLFKNYGYVHYDVDGYMNDDELDIDEVIEGMKQKDNIKGVPSFKSVASSGSDVWALVNTGELLDDLMASGELEDYKLLEDYGLTVPDFTDTYVYATVMFEKSAVKVSAGMDFPAKERKRLEKEYDYIATVSGDYFKYLSEDAVAVLAMNVDFKEFLSKTGIVSSLSLPSMVEDVLNSFTGEIVAGLNDIKLDYYGDLEDIDATAIAKVDNDEFISPVNKMIGGSETGDNCYSVELDDNIDIYYGVDGKELYVSTSSDFRKGLKKADGNFSKKGGPASGNYSYFGVNVDKLTDLLKDELDAETIAVLSPFEFAYMTQPTMFGCEIVVEVSGSKNPLEIAVSLLQDAVNLNY